MQIKPLTMCLVALLVTGRPLVAQSLADIARKEGERRKTLKEPAKVISNKDLVGGTDATTGSPDAASATTAVAGKEDQNKAGANDSKDPAKSAKEADKGSKEAVKDQAYWSGR